MPTANGIIKPVEDGKVVDSSAEANSPSAKKKSGSTLDKEAFLKLLVAQMKYQDPLEPTSNTEYIAQLATFSSLEEMQNLNATMTTMQGANLVGKQVVMNVTSETTGITTKVSGFVEYVMRENGKTFLVIDGSPYNIDDLESVVDEAYIDAVALAESFKQAVAKLPNVRQVTLDDKESIEKVKEAVNKMNGYQQGFLDADSLTKLRDLLKRIEELEKQVEKPDQPGGDTEKPTDPDGEDKTDETNGTDKEDETK